MPSQKSQKKSIRRHYSPEFKIEALGLAEQVGVAGAAKQLGLHVPAPGQHRPAIHPPQVVRPIQPGELGKAEHGLPVCGLGVGADEVVQPEVFRPRGVGLGKTSAQA